MVQQRRVDVLELVSIQRPAGNRQRPLQRQPRAAADQAARHVQRNRLTPGHLQRQVHRRGDVGRRIHQRAIEVKTYDAERKCAHGRVPWRDAVESAIIWWHGPLL
jgi:hypothetical protein